MLLQNAAAHRVATQQPADFINEGRPAQRQARQSFIIACVTRNMGSSAGDSSLQQNLSSGRSALLRAELRKGGVISFGITQIKHALTVQIDFLDRKQTFIYIKKILQHPGR